MTIFFFFGIFLDSPAKNLKIIVQFDLMSFQSQFVYFLDRFPQVDVSKFSFLLMN